MCRKLKVCAIVVTFHPDDGFPARFKAIAKQVDSVFVVDNGSSREPASMLVDLAAEGRIELISNAANLGIAAALNQGVEAALAKGYEWAITLDQDSTASPDMAYNLLESLLESSNPEMIALVGPRFTHRDLPREETLWLRPNPALPLLYQRVPCREADLEDLTLVITSGALTNLVICRKLGMFREDLFIDHVDTEYCLRAKQNGYGILLSSKAHLEHRRGTKQVKRWLLFKLTPTFHDANRLYYIWRNRVYLAGRYALRFPHWFLFDLVSGSYSLLCIFAAEENRMLKLGSILEGVRDGFAGRLGARQAK